MSSWYVQRSGINFILKQNGETVGKIQAISASKTLGSVNIKLVEDDKLITPSLSTYRPAEKTDQFISCLSSRTKFVEKWSEISKDAIHQVEDTVNSVHVENKEHDDVQVEDKLAYSYVLVHIGNLKEPAHERKFRDVDQKHVDDLKAKIIQNPDLKCRIMLGNVMKNKECLTEDFLKTPGKVDVEVIGGNHTRTAIIQILDDHQYKHDTRYHLWPVKVYCQLDRIQAQKLGFDHNIENDSVRPTSAFDILHFARKELLTLTNGLNVCTAPQLKEWKTNIIHVLNLSKEDLHNKYKTLVSLAKSPTCVWEKLVQFEEQWKKRLILGQTPGDIKTGHLKPVSLLKENDQVELLNELIKRNMTWKNFRKTCSEKQKDQQKTSDTEVCQANNKTATTIHPETGQHINDVERERCKDLKKKLDSALATIRLLTEESENLKSRLADSENKNRMIEEHLARNQSKNVELCHEVELLKSQKRELENDVAYYQSKDKSDNSLHSSKRKDTDSEDDQLAVQHTKKKVIRAAENIPEPREEEANDSEQQEKVLFVEYTRRRGFLAVQSTSGKLVRYCKISMCQNIWCPTLKLIPNCFALEEKAYCLDVNYIIAEIPNSIMSVRGNELVVLQNGDVLRDFLMKSISAYLNAQT